MNLVLVVWEVFQHSENLLHNVNAVKWMTAAASVFLVPKTPSPL